ncbi:MAG: GAF domain-containing protein [Gammaproteobacteria bacterium]
MSRWAPRNGKLRQEIATPELGEGSAQAQQELGNRTRQLMAVARISRRVLASPELRKLLMKETVALIARVLRVDYVKFLVLLPHGKAFRLQADVSWPEDLGSQNEIPLTPDSVAGYTLRCGTPVIVQDRRTDPRFEASVAIDERDLVSGMSVVVGAAEAPQGVLCAYTGSKRTFFEKELGFLLPRLRRWGS